MTLSSDIIINNHINTKQLNKHNHHTNDTNTNSATSNIHHTTTDRCTGSNSAESTSITTPNGFIISRSEYIRVLAQALNELGCSNTVTALISETNHYIDQPYVQQLRSAILDGCWNDVDSIVSKVRLDLDSYDAINRLIKTQRFIELIAESCDNHATHSNTNNKSITDVSVHALQYLQTDIATAQFSKSQIQRLASYLMCDTMNELENTAQWNSSTSRQILLSEVMRYIPASASLPSNRLQHIIDDAFNYQIQQCSYHNSTQTNYSLLQTHMCDTAVSFKLAHTLNNHTAAVNDVRFSHSGHKFASCSDDHTVIIWSCYTNNQWHTPTVEHVLSSHKSAVQLALWCSDDSMLLSAEADTSEFIVWNAVDGTIIVSHHHDIDEPITAAAWIPSNKYSNNNTHILQHQFVTASTDGQLILWSIEPNKDSNSNGNTSSTIANHSSTSATTYMCINTYTWTTHIVQDIMCTPDGYYIISATSSNSILVYNIHNKNHFTINGSKNITSLAISRDGKSLIVNTRQPSVYQLYTLNQHRFDHSIHHELSTSDTSSTSNSPATQIQEFHGYVQNKYVIRACFGGDSDSYIGSGSEDGRVYIYRRGAHQPILQLHSHTAPVNSVSWCSSRPAMFVSCSDDYTICVWIDSRQQHNSTRDQTLTSKHTQQTNGATKQIDYNI